VPPTAAYKDAVRKDDGATGFDFVDVDLLALPQCLDEVETFAYDPDYGKLSPNYATRKSAF
jgi:hypothetical protein